MNAIKWVWVVTTLVLTMAVSLIDIVARGIAVVLLYFSKILNAAIYSTWAIGSNSVAERVFRAYNDANDSVHHIMQPKSSRKEEEA